VVDPYRIDLSGGPFVAITTEASAGVDDVTAVKFTDAAIHVDPDAP
jgi:hypothetical protein